MFFGLESVLIWGPRKAQIGELVDRRACPCPSIEPGIQLPFLLPVQSVQFIAMVEIKKSV